MLVCEILICVCRPICCVSHCYSAIWVLEFYGAIIVAKVPNTICV